MYSTLSICVGRSPSGGPRGQALVTMACRSHPLGGDASGRPRFLFGGSGATSTNERVVLRPHFRQDGFHAHGEPPLSHAAPRRGSGGVSGVGTVRAGKRVTRQSPGPGPGHRGGADLWHDPRRPHVTASRERGRTQLARRCGPAFVWGPRTLRSPTLPKPLTERGLPLKFFASFEMTTRGHPTDSFRASSGGRAPGDRLTCTLSEDSL